MRYLSIMKDLGPRRMSQDQRPRTQRSGFKIQNQNRNQLPRFKNKDQESKQKPQVIKIQGRRTMSQRPK